MTSDDSHDDGFAARMKRRFAGLRRRHPVLDHLLRAWTHYSDVRGNQLAGAVTYFGFLSFFPLLALGFAAIGFVVVIYPQAEADVRQALTEALPGLVGDGPNQLNLDTFTGARRSASIVGLAGLVYTGLGWVDGLREALRQIFLLPRREGNIVVKKLADLLVLLLLGVGALTALAVSSFSTAVTRQALELVGLEGSTVALVGLKALAVVLSIGVTTLLLLIVFTRLPGRGIPWREAVQGALAGAIGIQVLLLLGTYLLSGTTGNALYGAFAVIVGLLVWINFVSRTTLLAAAWTAADRKVGPRVDASPVEPRPVDTAHAGPAGKGGLLAAVGVAGLVVMRRRGGP